MITDTDDLRLFYLYYTIRIEVLPYIMLFNLA